MPFVNKNFVNTFVLNAKVMWTTREIDIFYIHIFCAAEISKLHSILKNQQNEGLSIKKTAAGLWRQNFKVASLTTNSLSTKVVVSKVIVGFYSFFL